MEEMGGGIEINFPMPSCEDYDVWIQFNIEAHYPQPKRRPTTAFIVKTTWRWFCFINKILKLLLYHLLTKSLT